MDIQDSQRQSTQLNLKRAMKENTSKEKEMGMELIFTKMGIDILENGEIMKSMELELFLI